MLFMYTIIYPSLKPHLEYKKIRNSSCMPKRLSFYWHLTNFLLQPDWYIEIVSIALKKAQKMIRIDEILFVDDSIVNTEAAYKFE